jgi:hypothetical protein
MKADLLKGLLNLQSIAKSVIPPASVLLQQTSVGHQLVYQRTPKRPAAIFNLRRKYGMNSFQLCLLPSNLFPSHFASLQHEIREAFPPPLTYEYLFNFVNVTYIEVAYDTSVDSVGQLLPSMRSVQLSRVIKNGGVPGTFYLGAIGAKQSFAIYDKRAQMQAKGVACVNERLTRIESRTTRLSAPACSLHETMPNPFMRLEIAELGTATLLSNEPTWKKFLQEAQDLGTANALKAYPKQRRLFKKLLREASASWWKPNSIWSEGFAAAMARLSPVQCN